jgi:hypothetical protein
MARRRMQMLDSIVRYLWLVAIAGHAILYYRLWRTGLRRTYRFFAAYVLFRLLRSALLEIGPLFVPNARFVGSNLYAQLWMATEPVLWMLYVLVVLELYSLVFQKYKGIASLGRWVVLAGLAVALVLSSLSLSADLSNPAEQFPILRYFLAIGRGVLSSLVIFLLCITTFLAWCPVPLNRNIVLHTIVYAIYFLGMALTILLRNLTGSTVTMYANIAILLVSIGCLATWIVKLDVKGERRSVTLRHRWQAGQEQQVVEQLAAINSSLMRTTRK